MFPIFINTHPVVENRAIKARFKGIGIDEFETLWNYKAPAMAILSKKNISYSLLSKTDQSFYFTQMALAADDIKRFYRQTLREQRTNQYYQIESVRLVKTLKSIKHQQNYDEIIYDWLPALHSLAEKTTP